MCFPIWSYQAFKITVVIVIIIIIIIILVVVVVIVVVVVVVVEVMVVLVLVVHTYILQKLFRFFSRSLPGNACFVLYGS